MSTRKAKQRPVSSGTDADERILSTAELVKRIPLRRETIARLVREGRFPAPIQLTTSRIGWRWSAVLDWLNECETHPGRRRSYLKRDLGRVSFKRTQTKVSREPRDEAGP